MNVEFNFPQHQAILQQRLGNITLGDYAEVLAKRERLLDDGEIRKGFFGVKGDKDWVISMLEGSCQRYGLPLVPGDLERTARSAEWDAQIRTNPAVKAAWRDVYAAALVAMNNLPTFGPEFEQHRQRFLQSDEVLFNPFQTIGKRKPKISTSAKTAHQAAVVNAFVAPSADPDPVIFPGERLSRVSDFVRIARAMQVGDFPGVLQREGIDMGYYGQMSIRWAQVMQSDPTITAAYTRQLMGG